MFIIPPFPKYPYFVKTPFTMALKPTPNIAIITAKAADIPRFLLAKMRHDTYKYLVKMIRHLD